MKLRLVAAALLCAASTCSFAVQTIFGDVDELRIGIMDHDTDLFSSTVEKGADLNLEMLLKSPDWLKWAFSPRPNMGLMLNSENGTNLLYLGSAWKIPFGAGFFGEGNLAIAFNDSEKNQGRTDKRNIGCSVGFYESVSVGYQFWGHHQIMGLIDHASNGGFCPPNSGLTAIGARYGYNF